MLGAPRLRANVRGARTFQPCFASGEIGVSGTFKPQSWEDLRKAFAGLPKKSAQAPDTVKQSTQPQKAKKSVPKKPARPSSLNKPQTKANPGKSAPSSDGQRKKAKSPAPKAATKSQKTKRPTIAVKQKQPAASSSIDLESSISPQASTVHAPVQAGVDADSSSRGFAAPVQADGETSSPSKGFAAAVQAGDHTGSPSKGFAAPQVVPSRDSLRVFRYSISECQLQEAFKHAGWESRVSLASEVQEADVVVSAKVSASGKHINHVQAQKLAANLGVPFVCLGRKISKASVIAGLQDILLQKERGIMGQSTKPAAADADPTSVEADTSRSDAAESCIHAAESCINA